MILHPPRWSNRYQAGLELAERLKTSAGRDHDSTVIGLPRGGVPVAVAIGRQLRLPVATWSVRKVADPLQPELAIGAISAGKVAVWRNGQAAVRCQEQALSQGWLQLQERELERRQKLFCDPSPKQLRNRHLIVVDDGIATGMTVRAALLSLRQAEPRSITLAIPVADRAVASQLRKLVDQLEILVLVEQLQSVGMWYGTFNQLEDREVLDLLAAGTYPKRPSEITPCP